MEDALFDFVHRDGQPPGLGIKESVPLFYCDWLLSLFERERACSLKKLELSDASVFELHDISNRPDSLPVITLTLLSHAHGPPSEVYPGAVKLILEGLDLWVPEQPPYLRGQAGIF